MDILNVSLPAQGNFKISGITPEIITSGDISF
jgi:hypothetical protein